MERRLIVMRHAKSSWDSDALSDHERPLNRRGQRDAPLVGQRLSQLGWAPELVLSSDAVRTQQTWTLMSRCFERLVVCYLPSFYGAGSDAVRKALGHVPEEVRTVLVLGHNPGWEDLVSEWVGQATTLTTANAALLVAAGASWAAVAVRGTPWQLERVIRPKEL